MAIFEAIRLTWNGKDYTIPPDNVLKAIAKLEDALTLGELATCMDRGRLPLAKLAIAYASLLRHAGAQCTDEEVYAAMFAGTGRELQQQALERAMTLYRMMIPPKSLQGDPGKEAAAEVAGSSPSATSSPSVPAG